MKSKTSLYILFCFICPFIYPLHASSDAGSVRTKEEFETIQQEWRNFMTENGNVIEQYNDLIEQYNDLVGEKESIETERDSLKMDYELMVAELQSVYKKLALQSEEEETKRKNRELILEHTQEVERRQNVQQILEMSNTLALQQEKLDNQLAVTNKLKQDKISYKQANDTKDSIIKGQEAQIDNNDKKMQTFLSKQNLLLAYIHELEETITVQNETCSILQKAYGDLQKAYGALEEKCDKEYGKANQQVHPLRQQKTLKNLFADISRNNTTSSKDGSQSQHNSNEAQSQYSIYTKDSNKGDSYHSCSSSTRCSDLLDRDQAISVDNMQLPSNASVLNRSATELSEHHNQASVNKARNVIEKSTRWLEKIQKQQKRPSFRNRRNFSQSAEDFFKSILPNSTFKEKDNSDGIFLRMAECFSWNIDKDLNSDHNMQKLHSMLAAIGGLFILWHFFRIIVTCLLQLQTLSYYSSMFSLTDSSDLNNTALNTPVAFLSLQASPPLLAPCNSKNTDASSKAKAFPDTTQGIEEDDWRWNSLYEYFWAKIKKIF